MVDVYKRQMFIQGHDDDQLRLRDIALIEKGYEDPTRNEMFYNQERSIGILVAASSGSDIVKVGKAVEAKLAELKDNRLPAGVDCHKIFYQPERVGDSLGTFVINQMCIRDRFWYSFIERAATSFTLEEPTLAVIFFGISERLIRSSVALSFTKRCV